jgi:hypothetical protein
MKMLNDRNPVKDTPLTPLKRGIIVTILLCCFCIANAVNPPTDLHQLRQKLILALSSSKTTDSLYTCLDKLSNKPPVITAYLGTLDALKAKHSWNPYSKIRYLNTSQQVLQQAVTADPHNIEIRFMRFSIEHNVPGFLGMNKNLAADRDEMILQLNNKNYGTADKLLTTRIIKFLLDSKRCTSPENETLHKQLAAL